MEVACNMVPFAAASNNNLNPILEDVDEDIIEDVVQHWAVLFILYILDSYFTR